MPDDIDREAQRIFEWRILALEKSDQDREGRLRKIENEIAQMSEKMNAFPEMRSQLQRLFDDRYKNLVGFVLVMVTVIGTFLFSHFTEVVSR